MRRTSLVLLMIGMLLMMGGCSGTSRGTKIIDTCKRAPLGGLPGYHGTFTIDGRPAAQEEIDARVIPSEQEGADMTSYIHVKSFTDEIAYTAELDPRCPYAAKNLREGIPEQPSSLYEGWEEVPLDSTEGRNYFDLPNDSCDYYLLGGMLGDIDGGAQPTYEYYLGGRPATKQEISSHTQYPENVADAPARYHVNSVWRSDSKVRINLNMDCEYARGK